MGKLANTAEMASLNAEMRVSCVGGEGRGQCVVWLVNFAWDKSMCKSQTLDDPNYPDQKRKSGNCMLNALPILEIVCLSYYKWSPPKVVPLDSLRQNNWSSLGPSTV